MGSDSAAIRRNDCRITDQHPIAEVSRLSVADERDPTRFYCLSSPNLDEDGSFAYGDQKWDRQFLPAEWSDAVTGKTVLCSRYRNHKQEGDVMQPDTIIPDYTKIFTLS